MEEKKHKVKIESANSKLIENEKQIKKVIKQEYTKRESIGQEKLKVQLKSQTGITLITLAIMILIIIILAGITISVTLGDNGLLSQAQEAKDMAEGSVNEYRDKMQGVLDEYQDIMRESLNLQISESHTTQSITIEVETTSSK